MKAQRQAVTNAELRGTACLVGERHFTVMKSVGNRALRRAIDCIADLSATMSVAQFGAVGVARLPRLVASELTTLSICDLRSGQRRVISDRPGAISRRDLAAFDRHFAEHPLVRFHAYRRGVDSHRISDSLSPRAFRASALYADYYRPVGLDCALAVPLYVDRNTLVSFVFNRTGRDFFDAEVTLLDLLRPTLAALYRRHAQGEAALRSAAGANLTSREREVLSWVAAGKTNRDISVLLSARVRTIEKHLEHIFVKLGVETRTAAAMRGAGPVTNG
jgi:DNA-binding CsgD family transcriptional regulator